MDHFSCGLYHYPQITEQELSKCKQSPSSSTTGHHNSYHRRQDCVFDARGTNLIVEGSKTHRRNQSTSIFFKFGLLFVSQEVVSTVFEPRNFTCPINRLPWNIYETTKLFNFIQSRTRGTPFLERLENLMKTFKDKKASRRTVEQLVANRMTQLNQSSMLMFDKEDEKINNICLVVEDRKFWCSKQIDFLRLDGIPLYRQQNLDVQPSPPPSRRNWDLESSSEPYQLTTCLPIKNCGSQELQNVQKFVTWLFNHISGQGPQSEVIVVVTNFNTDMVTYLYDLDHATHPILGVPNRTTHLNSIIVSMEIILNCGSSESQNSTVLKGINREETTSSGRASENFEF
ncbi:hypothetical protein CAEBREN_00880 [Caenorhabditis brenneri]|uniref:Uncharacterized protein n=1 Tax=Caenorhabditis brenneri TaxID=135651 RepID=G0P510_CAEBE|nr:hypothetical protein CAEBREN_00880 [Caenorhabditis brenneri]